MRTKNKIDNTPYQELLWKACGPWVYVKDSTRAVMLCQSDTHAQQIVDTHNALLLLGLSPTEKSMIQITDFGKQGIKLILKYIKY